MNITRDDPARIRAIPGRAEARCRRKRVVSVSAGALVLTRCGVASATR